MNPALKQFATLVGKWKTAGTHPLLPGKIINGRASFEWIEDGAFLKWQSEMEDNNFPKGIAIFGSDDATGDYYMLYFDSRNVSRKYNVSIKDDVISWWRNAPKFSQRYTWTITGNGKSVVGKGELSKDGKTWEKDLEQTFTRID